MNDFFSNLASPSWWLGVVIVGILINLVSAYLKPRLDHRFSGWSRRWATRSEEQRRLRAARIQKLRESQHEQLMAASTVLYWRLRSLACLVMAIMFTVLAMQIEVMGTSHPKLLLIPMFIATFATVLALEFHRTAARDQIELWEARRDEGTLGKKVESA